MLVRVTCAGILIGTADFDAPVGLAHAALSPTLGYPIAAPMAEALGEELAETRLWSVGAGDFADALARRWKGGRLALQDSTGRELAVANVVVLEWPMGARLARVVADFRADAGQVAARVQPAA